MKPLKTTRPMTVNALTLKRSSHFSPRSFSALHDYQQDRRKENKTGLPDKWKAGIENLSGISLDDVKVHYNSAKPSELGAYAYTRGNNIHVGPGQEHHLPHEAWHVVQQAQDRVHPTHTFEHLRMNADPRLEAEAEHMGDIATARTHSHTVDTTSKRHDPDRGDPAPTSESSIAGVIQGWGWPALIAGGVLAGGALLGLGRALYNRWGGKRRDPAEDRLQRAGSRGQRRRSRERIPNEEFDTPTGIGRLSASNNQRMAQTTKKNWEGDTLGSWPGYSDVKAHLPDAALPSLLSRSEQPPVLTRRQRLAATLTSLLVHGSEEDRTPGASFFTRSLINRRIADPTAPHPLDIAVNPLVGRDGPQLTRELLAGDRPINADQRMAVDEHGDPSSDEDEDYYQFRGSNPLWKKRK